ncbi:hypothetical protein DFQ26_009930 [Actinomortierella ambigua]|nr:hypothetical protein DFQ26_009930 [Actinomortierella ambigua]
MSSRLILSLIVIVLGMLFFISLLFSRQSSDIYYPDLVSSPSHVYNPDPMALLDLPQPVRHSYQELLKLSSRFMLNEDGSAALTAIIHPTDYGPALSHQVQALLAQTVQPEAIWITTVEDNVGNAQAWWQQLPINDRVSLRIVDKDQEWFQAARKASTEFFLLLENGVLPGKSYLAALLRMAHTPEYSQAILGSHGATMPPLHQSPSDDLDHGQKLRCLPEHNNHGEIPATETVDVLQDIFFGRTEALELLSLENYPRGANMPVGVYLSTMMRFHGSIPSVVVANDPNNLATWGDIRKKDQKSTFCSALQQHYHDNPVWHQWIRRGNALTSQRDKLAVVFIFVENAKHATQLRDLICDWSTRPDLSIHVGVAGSHYGLGLHDFARLMPSEGCRMGVYDLKLSHPHHLNSNEAISPVERARLLAEVSVHAVHLLSHLQPRTMFYLQVPGSLLSEGLDIARRTVNTPSIVIKPQDIEHVQWLPDLSVEALENWNTPEIRMVVITNNRPGSCIRLLSSLSQAHYLNDKVPLMLNMDAEADRVTIQMAGSFEWEHGPKLLRHRVRRGGLMLAVVEAWYPEGDHEYAVLLEDDVEVSPLFYSWIKYNILRYRYSPGHHLYHRMFGVSMYSQKFVETHLSGRSPFNPEDIFIETPEYELRTPFLLQLPCSWGAVYFPEHWREFHEYVADRLLDIEWNKTSLQAVQIPRSRTNRWSNSWKKLFIEMIYMRGYVMLYPNYFNFTSFSTNHLEWGTHTKQQRNSAGTFLVPLMMEPTKMLGDLPNHRLPDWDSLPVLDLWASLSTSAELVKRGRELQEQLNPCLRRNHRDEVIWEGQEKDLKCPKTLPYYSTHSTPAPKTLSTASRDLETMTISPISPDLSQPSPTAPGSPAEAIMTPLSSADDDGEDDERGAGPSRNGPVLDGPAPTPSASPSPSPSESTENNWMRKRGDAQVTPAP